MTQEETIHYCYKHKNRETRLSCNECGRFICTDCVIQAPVGFKCSECIKGKHTHLETLTPQQYLIASVVSFTIACIAGFIWHGIENTIWLALFFSYLIGFSVTKITCSIIGYKIGFRIQAIVSVSIILGLIYNPIATILDFINKGFNPLTILNHIALPLSYFTPLLLVSLAIAIWAAIRHFRR